jgi:hypothetical protein
MSGSLCARAALGTTLLLCPLVALAEPGYSDYLEWVDWARLKPGVTAGLASSYDRTGENADYSWYEWPEYQPLDAMVCTVKTIDGPGIIYRFWMPHLTAKRIFDISMYFDGESTPRIDTTSDVLLGGGFSYFSAPLVSTFAGGQVGYEPIPFAQSLVIEMTNKALPASGWSSNRNYYQYTYATFPPGTPLVSYSGTLTPEQEAERAAVVAMFDNAGSHPAGISPTAICVPTGSSSIPAGERLTLADLAGPGIIRQISLCMDDPTDDELEGLRLEVFYDDDASAAIDVPVGHFFGAGRERAPYSSLPLGTDSPDGCYSYWPMPFRQAVQVKLYNTAGAPITVDAAVVEYEPTTVDDDMGSLYVRAFTGFKAPEQLCHPVLSVRGRGHYVGNLLYIEQSWWSFEMLEGDDIVTVDGAEGLYGTGLEDAYNGGYYYNWVGVQEDEPEGGMPQSAIRPLNGILYVHREDGVQHARADQYRWYIADRVGFSTSIDVKIENRYAADGAEWTSVAFWYWQPPLTGDADVDYDLDLEDFAAFQSCFAEQTPECAEVFDHDGGGIGLSDHAYFVQQTTGPLEGE